jgi:hypothetical protein
MSYLAQTTKPFAGMGKRKESNKRIPKSILEGQSICKCKEFINQDHSQERYFQYDSRSWNALGRFGQYLGRKAAY